MTVGAHAAEETHPPRRRDARLLCTKAYVDGEWIEGAGGRTFPVLDPATGQTIADIPRMGAEETRRAIAAAARALPGWRGLLAKERARILRRWADLMLENQEDLAVLLTTRHLLVKVLPPEAGKA